MVANENVLLAAVSVFALALTVIGVIVGFVIASNERRSHHAGAEAAHSV